MCIRDRCPGLFQSAGAVHLARRAADVLRRGGVAVRPAFEGWGAKTGEVEARRRCGREVTMALRRFLLGLVLACATVFSAMPAHAVQPDEILDDPGLEARARDLSAGLRCLVCQNQSIDDSDAPLAKDLRVLVRERLKAGDSDEEILEFIVARYGEFVLLKPRFSPHTWLLWLATPLVLLAALGTIAYAYRRRTLAAERPKPLTANEKRRLKRLMGEG